MSGQQVTTPGGVGVEQGPEWLANVLFGYEPWMLPAILGVACLVAAGGLWGYQQYGLSDETKHAMAVNGTMVVAVAGSVQLAKVYLSLSYFGDVVVGLAIGGAITAGLSRYCYQPLVEEHRQQRS